MILNKHVSKGVAQRVKRSKIVVYDDDLAQYADGMDGLEDDDFSETPRIY